MSRNKDELVSNETTSSALRRSTRLAQNVPSPAPVITRRASASEESTSTPVRVTRSRRPSLSQESTASSSSSTTDTAKTQTRSSSRSPVSLSQDSGTPSTRKTRRGSVTRTIEESREVSTPTRRTRASSRAESLSPSEKSKGTPLKKTRSRRSSIAEKESTENGDDNTETKTSTDKSDNEPEKQNVENPKIDEDCKEGKKISKRRLSLMDVTPLEVIEEREDATSNQDVPLKKRKNDESTKDPNLSIIEETEDDVKTVENNANRNEESEKTSSSPIKNSVVNAPEPNEKKIQEATPPSSPTKKNVSDTPKLIQKSPTKSEELNSLNNIESVPENAHVTDEILRSPSLLNRSLTINSPKKSESNKLNTSKRKSLSLKSESDDNDDDLLQDENPEKNGESPLVNSLAINDSSDSLRLNLSSTILNSSQNLTDKSLTPKSDKSKEKICSPNENDMNKVNSNISCDKDTISRNLNESKKEYSFYEPMEVDETIVQNVTVNMSKNNELFGSPSKITDSKINDDIKTDINSPKITILTNTIIKMSCEKDSIEDLEKSLKNVLADTSPSKNRRKNELEELGEKSSLASPVCMERLSLEDDEESNETNSSNRDKKSSVENIDDTNEKTNLKTTTQENSESNTTVISDVKNQNENVEIQEIVSSDEDKENSSEDVREKTNNQPDSNELKKTELDPDENDETITGGLEKQNDPSENATEDKHTSLNKENENDDEQQDSGEEDEQNESDEDEQNEDEEDDHDQNENSSESSVTAKLEYLIKKKIQDDKSDSSDDDFVLSEAEEGEEDTPSVGSNDIIDEGESVGSSCELESLGSYDDNDSFIDDGDVEILEGFSRILKPKDSTDDEDELEELQIEEVKSMKKITRKSNETNSYKRIVMPNDSEEDSVEANDNVINLEENKVEEESKDVEKEETKQLTLEINTPSKELHRSASLPSIDNLHESIVEETNETETNLDSSRKRSISLSETIRVEDIKNESLVKQISDMVNVFCSNLKDGSKEVSLNVSVEYFDNKLKNETELNESKTTTPTKISLGDDDLVCIDIKETNKNESTTEKSKLMKRKHSTSELNVSSICLKKPKLTGDSEEINLIDDDLNEEILSSEVSKKKKKKRNKRNKTDFEQNKSDVSSLNQLEPTDWQIEKVEISEIDKKHKKKDKIVTDNQQDEASNKSVPSHDKKQTKKKKKQIEIDNAVEVTDIQTVNIVDQEIAKSKKKKNKSNKKQTSEETDVIRSSELPVTSKKKHSKKSSEIIYNDETPINEDQEITKSKKNKFDKKQSGEEMDDVMSTDELSVVSKKKKSKKAPKIEDEDLKPRKRNKQKRAHECEIASDDEVFVDETEIPKKKKKKMESESEKFVTKSQKNLVGHKNKKSKQEETETILLRNKKKIPRTGEMFGITPTIFKDLEKQQKATKDVEKTQNTPGWSIEKVESAKPSTSNVKNTPSYTFHSKDFKNKMLFESGRINRESTKNMLKRKQKYF